MASQRAVRPSRVLVVVAILCALAVLVTVVAVRVTGRSTPGDGGDAPLAGPAVAGSCAGRPTTAPRELRGMWLTTVYNIDWPSKPGLDEQTVKAEYLGWLDLAQRLHFNAIFVHIRPSGDALWPSQFAPWSEWLTGKRDGVGPGWDPLEFMVAQTHARNLEFHAWFNPYRGDEPAPASAGADLNALAPNHPLRVHPEWAVAYPVGTPDSKLYFDPGIPAARTFVEDAMLEAVSRYDIDGVHFDDFFYPYPAAGQTFNDANSFATYSGGFTNRADWRRDNVDKLVREMSQRIKAIKPWVKFGISPFGIWRNDNTDPTGSATRGLQSYDDIYADTRTWVKKGWLDYVVPQLYWPIGFDKADYAKVLPWWSNLVTGTKVQLYIGMADYRVGEAGAWSDPAELDRQFALNAHYAVNGTIHFSAMSLRSDALGAVTRYTADHDATPALVPVMPQLPGAPPAAPVRTAAHRDGTGATALTWQPGPGTPATSFAVYQVDSATGTAGSGGTGDPARLVATVRAAGAGTQTWTDRSAANGSPRRYCVTALDRLWHESAATSAVAAQ
jgi:uncharacterized lipoprotein YddW (UPF0748 family)